MRKLIVKGKEFDAIHVLVGDAPAERNAAAEFVRYMEKIGIPEGEGLNVRFSRDNTIGIDGYRICIKEESTIEFIGGKGCGLLYSVYDFLEKYAGVRYFTPDCESLGEGDIVFDEDYGYTPVIEQRTSDFYRFCGDRNWALKNHITVKVPAEIGESYDYSVGGVHTFEKFSGVPQSSQPCLSDPEVLKKAIAWVREVLKKNPHARSVSVTQNDNLNGYCTCEKCAKIDAEEQSHAGTVIRFVNAIAEEISGDYPDVLIETFAYRYSQKPPAITKAHPNVYIRLCSIGNCFSHRIDDSTCRINAQFDEDMKNWCKIVDRVHIWDYVANFAGYVPTYPNFGTMRDNMRYYAEHNVKGMYPEGPYNSYYSGEFGELRTYLLAKLMWNPYMTANEYYTHMDEFLAAYYGAGWRYIRAYIDFTIPEAEQCHMKLCRPQFEMIPKDKWEAMADTFDMWWNKALEMAGDKAENVRTSMLQWDFMRLMVHPNEEDGRKLMEAVETKGIVWDESNTKAKEDRLGLEPEEWVKP